MKIEKNQENLIEAWEIAINALHAIKQTLIDNRKQDNAVIDAYYQLLRATNLWHDEIKQMPF